MNINELNENLEAQLMLFKEFTRLGHLKKEALVHNNLQELDAVTLQEEKLLLQLGVIEENRLSWITLISETLGKNPLEVTLAELTKDYPELNNVYNKLEKTIEDLRQIHNLNSQLIDQALKTINFSINLFNPTEKNIYKNPEQKDVINPTVHLVDQKI